MEQSDNPEKIGQLSLGEDIPQALRDEQPRPLPQSFPWRKWGLGVGISAIALMVAGIFLWYEDFWSQKPMSLPQETTLGPSVPEVFPQPENLLGHLPYGEAPLSDLKPITSDGRIKLRALAAEKFLQMEEDAKRSGIMLEVISGFRSVKEQEEIFFQVKEQRGQEVTERADVSAPPGYSEHHTGYAIDIGDRKFPDTHLSVNFEKTPAFQWLAKNAARYSFELSFPKENLQGVSYEPWHWRFVGDRHSLETFYKAKNLSTPLNDRKN